MKTKIYEKPQMVTVAINTKEVICMAVSGTTSNPLSKEYDDPDTEWN